MEDPSTDALEGPINILAECDSSPPLKESALLEDVKKKTPKAPREKKRPSDFEIVRTIVQRTTERKLPVLLKNIGEPEDTYVVCSGGEPTFLFGSSALAITLLTISDPELKTVFRTELGKMYGFSDTQPIFINIRDQISELGKTKGASFTTEPQTTPDGDVWVKRASSRGESKPLYYCQSVKGLFHINILKEWMERYSPLVSGSLPENFHYEYKHPEGKTHSILNVPPHDDPDHPIVKMFPKGFRAMITRGFDVLISKMFPDHFPYKVNKEELIFTLIDRAACQMLHRVSGEGWSMLLVRPNFIFFPTVETSLPTSGPHVL